MESIWFIILLQGLIFGFFSSFIAREKGRHSGGWFFLGFFFSFIALLTLVAIPKQEIGSIRAENKTSPTIAICPFCREEVNPEAVICKHCRSDLKVKKPIIIDKSSLAENVPTGQKIQVESFEIKCPNCQEVERIPSDQKTNSDAYKKFSTDFNRLFNPRLRCKKCDTNFPYDPFGNGIFTGKYRRQLTSRSS
jgi:hypothetical protein